MALWLWEPPIFGMCQTRTGRLGRESKDPTAHSDDPARRNNSASGLYCCRLECPSFAGPENILGPMLKRPIRNDAGAMPIGLKASRRFSILAWRSLSGINSDGTGCGNGKDSNGGVFQWCR